MLFHSSFLHDSHTAQNIAGVQETQDAVNVFDSSWRQCIALWHTALSSLPTPRRVLVVPPDITRLHSGAKELLHAAYKQWHHTEFDILPALGTHRTMTNAQLTTMYGHFPSRVCYLAHDWRRSTRKVGNIRAQSISSILGYAVSRSWHVRINAALFSTRYDLCISLGQVVPHEVVGMSNYNKNIIIGLGGMESINLTHYWSACYGMDNLIGQTFTPIRRLLQKVDDLYLAERNILYAMTVMHPDTHPSPRPYALSVGNTIDSFYHAARYSQQVHIITLTQKVHKAVVYLDAQKYRSFWIANKAIYRLRKVIASGGELIIIAALDTYAEDAVIDSIIAKYGYRNPHLLQKEVARNRLLKKYAAAVAHIIHSEHTDITVRFAMEPNRQEFVTAVGFSFLPIARALQEYAPFNKKNGWYCSTSEEKYYFVRDPAHYLWQLAQ